MKNILIISIVLLCSCNSFLEEYSQDLAKVESVNDLDELLLGSAYYTAGYYTFGNYTYTANGEPFNIFIHFMADELKQNEQTDKGDICQAFSKMFGYFTWQRQVGINIKGTSVGIECNDWKKTYQYINVTNMILDELNRISPKNDKEKLDKIRIAGETHFLRALYYFTLVNLYAEPYTPTKASDTQGVPLKLTSYIEDKEYTSNSVAEVYHQIIKDLQEAEKYLTQTTTKSVYRADINATYLLTSRVYLYMQDYKNARKYAQLVLDQNNQLTDLNLFNGTDNIFTAENPEVLFSMGGHFLSNYIYGKDQTENQYPFYISNDLIEAFDSNNDLRKSYYITQGSSGYYYKKIYWGRAHFGSACSISDNFLFRTSEAYLNLAEAAAFDNDENTARETLGLLQAKRFSTAPSVTETGNNLIDLIRKERQRELCLEGHRWFDLRRYSVCEKYTWSKKIHHIYTDYDLTQGAVRTRTFELLPNDKAYTLSYPKEVLDFQNSLSTNQRPERIPIQEKSNN